MLVREEQRSAASGSRGAFGEGRSECDRVSQECKSGFRYSRFRERCV